MAKKIALVLGASGSVGFEILQVLLDHAEFDQVVAYVRKPVTGVASAKLSQVALPEMTPENLAEAVTRTLSQSSESGGEVLAFSALGVGANTAKLTIDQHRAIDVRLNQAFAQALRPSPRVKYLAFLSAMGANPQARTTGSGAAGMPRYARVKGEAEEAVKLHGPSAVGIFRPAIIRGSRHTPGLIDRIAPILDLFLPKKLHSSSTRELALAMVAASLGAPCVSGVYAYPEMRELIRK